jgi:hypothetical protein
MARTEMLIGGRWRTAMREIDAGSIHINWTPLWRADLMPYELARARPSTPGARGGRT